MKKTIITSIVISIIFSSCNQSSDEKESIETDPKIEIVDSTNVKVKPSLESFVEESVEERTQSFFNWYELNSSDLYGISSAVVGIKDNFYYLDTTNLNVYIAWLHETSFFSKSYVKQEEERWKDGCNDEMIQYKNAGEEADFIPPCVYEGDIIFLSQDVDVKEAVSKISISIDTLSETYAVVDYGVSKLYWTKEDGVWKISSLH